MDCRADLGSQFDFQIHYERRRPCNLSYETVTVIYKNRFIDMALSTMAMRCTVQEYGYARLMDSTTAQYRGKRSRGSVRGEASSS
jgi:hypothetical protein